MWKLNAALAAIILLSATREHMSWAQSGLLLGLGRPCLEEPCETVYRTLWIASHGDMVKIFELPDLIVPRQEGFWRVELECRPCVLHEGCGYPKCRSRSL